MQAAVLLGRDCRIVYQNERSAALRRFELGKPVIRECLVMPNEEIRDIIFSGKRLRLVDQPTRCEWAPGYLITRDYSPLLDADGNVEGIISIGYCRPALKAGELQELEAIVSALECPESHSALSGESPLLATCPSELSGSQRLALRLRRFLRQPPH